MTTRLAWESVEAMIAEHRRSLEADADAAEDGADAARVIAGLWDWAVSRESANAR